MADTLSKFKFYERDALFKHLRQPQTQQRISSDVTIRRDDFDQGATPVVFGYFFGGGYAFGVLENSGNRIKPEFYDLYRNSPAGTILDVPYYDRSTGQDWTGTTVKIKVGTDVPIFGDLRNLDRYAWQCPASAPMRQIEGAAFRRVLVSS